MHKPLILIVLLLSSSFTVLDAFSIDIATEETGGDEPRPQHTQPNKGIDGITEETGGDEPRPQVVNYIPFKEIATVVIDQKNDVTKISYSLMSKDNKDFLIPDSLEAKILNIERISTIVYTNEEKCAPGVLDATCILINIPYSKVGGVSFKEKQKVAREIGDSIIDDINQALGTNAKYHSVPIQTNADLSNTEEAVMNVVYTMNELSSKTLFAMFILNNIPDEIRFATGFFNHAYALSGDENSVLMFSISPEKNRSLYAFHISVTSNDNKIDLNNFSPLDLLHEDILNRSKLYADGFYPLNSIVNVLVFSEDKLQVLKTDSGIIGSLNNADELRKNGWYFVSSESVSADEMNKLDLRYLFGNTNSVSRQQLLLSINPIVEDVTPTQIGGWLPVGVKSPAPNFEREFGTITGLYEEIGSPEKNYTYTWGMKLVRGTAAETTSNIGLEFPDDAKIIKGDKSELLVFNLLITNNDDSSVTYYPERSKMYDGKDRVFDSLTHEIENPTSWSEDCPVNPVVIRPGLGQLLKLCFEIPKDADHFKIVTLIGKSQPFAYDVVAVFDRLGIGEDALSLDDGHSLIKNRDFDRLGIGEDALSQPAEETNQGGGCLIATSAFGSEMAPRVQLLREIRDNTVLQTELGTSFMTGFNQFYYSFSPAIADYERENPAFKETVKLALTPLLTSLTLLQYANIDSESEMLGYGIGVILLNIGMYFVAPVVLIMTVRKRI